MPGELSMKDHEQEIMTDAGVYRLLYDARADRVEASVDGSDVRVVYEDVRRRFRQPVDALVGAAVVLVEKAKLVDLTVSRRAGGA